MRFVLGYVATQSPMRPREAGTPRLRKLSPLPEIWSLDFVATRFAGRVSPTRISPAQTRWRPSEAQCSREVEGFRSLTVRIDDSIQQVGLTISREPVDNDAVAFSYARGIQPISGRRQGDVDNGGCRELSGPNAVVPGSKRFARRHGRWRQ